MGIIKGIVKNFHFASLHQEIGPLVMYNKGFRQTMLVRLAPGNLPEQIEQLLIKFGFKLDRYILKNVVPHHHCLVFKKNDKNLTLFSKIREAINTF